MTPLAWLLSACAVPPEAPPAAPDPAEARAAPVPIGLPSCGLAAAPTRTRQVTLRLAVGGGLDPRQVEAWVGQATAIWDEQGVGFVPVGPTDTVDVVTLLPSTLDDALARTSKGAKPAELLVELLAPARDLLGARHRADDDVHVVVLQRLSPPDGTLQKSMPGLDGLTLTPVAREGDAAHAMLVEAIGPQPFTPTVFVGAEDVRLGGPPLAVVIAHELGRALGLPHVAGSDNLMAAQRRADCVPGLTEAQLEAVGTR